MNLSKGDNIKITGNSIFEIMGHKVVTGEIFLIREDNSGCSIKCNQTGSYETLDYNDGKIIKLF